MVKHESASLGILLNMIHGFVLAMVSIFIMPSFLRMFTQDEAIVKMGVEYANVVFLFAVPNAAALILIAAAISWIICKKEIFR